jgi:hypothetical protein
MPKKQPSVFAEPVEEETQQVAEVQPVIVNPDNVTARIKGTWTMFWGKQVFEFQDGNRYSIPRDLFAYLKKNGNIYDTL